MAGGGGLCLISPGLHQSQTLHGTAIFAYIDPSGTTPGLIGSPMAVPLVVSGNY